MPIPQNDQNDQRDQTAGSFEHEVGHPLHDEPSAGESSTRQSWMQTTAFTGAAASLVLPLASDGAFNAIAQVVMPPAQAAASNNASSTSAAGQASAIAASQGVVPAVSQSSSAAFSTPVSSPAGIGDAINLGQASNQTSDSSAQSSLAQSPLLTKSADGSWALNYPATAAPETQAVMSQLVQNTQQTQQMCSGASCRGLDYINSQLPKARQQLQTAQSQLQAFESSNTQPAAAYKQLLASRLAEISQQKTELAISANQAQRQIERFKIQLDSLGIGDISLFMAAQSLTQNADYQTTWSQLVRTEQSLATEFSSANVDATALNEIYSDYAFHQQALQQLAVEAFGRYLASPSAEVSSDIKQMPDALKLIQALTIVVYEDQVQQLRLGTIGQIEKNLSERQQQLIVSIGQHERLQQQLVGAQQLVSGYEQARDRILTRQKTQLSKAEAVKAQSETALVRARELAPELPEGSTSQAILFAVLAAGAIATIAAQSRSSQRILLPTWTPKWTSPKWASPKWASKSTPKWALEEGSSSAMDWQDLASNLVTSDLVTVPAMDFAMDLSAMDLSKLASPIPVANLFTAELAEVQPDEFNDPMFDLSEIFADATPAEPELELYESVEAFEQRIFDELQEITRLSTHLANEAQTTQNQLLDSTEKALQRVADDSLTLELLTRNLDDILQQTTPEGSLAHEIRERGIAPVKISLAEVDILAELAIRWILKDLSHSSVASSVATELATELDTAEAEARGLAHSNLDDDEAVRTKSLKLKQHLQALATVS
jgi:hypothetical protein